MSKTAWLTSLSAALALMGGVALTAQNDAAQEQRVEAARARVASLSTAVGRLEDERAIENLENAFNYFADKALWKEAADVFADDATLEIGGRGVFVGKQRVLEYLTWLVPHGLTRGKLFNHLSLQPLITVAADGRAAQNRVRFLTQVGEYEKFAVWGVGTCENEYVKESGVWKIKKLSCYFRMYTNYADGWAKAALPNSRPEKVLPPDRPPSVVYDSYPATFIPPYHYKNPVTGK